MNNKEKLEKLKEIVEGNVGYKNPPKHTRFKKGQSGNPSGRKKKIVPKSLYEAFAMQLNETKSIKTENGASQKFTMLEIMMKKSIQDAIQKDGPSRKFFFDHFLKTDIEFAYKNIIEISERQSKQDQIDQEIKMSLLAKLEELIKGEENTP